MANTPMRRNKLKDSSLYEPFDYFYFAFGQLRDALWKISPRIKEYMLSDYTKVVKYED